jgi:hypothetical protein
MMTSNTNAIKIQTSIMSHRAVMILISSPKYDIKTVYKTVFLFSSVLGWHSLLSTCQAEMHGQAIGPDACPSNYVPQSDSQFFNGIDWHQPSIEVCVNNLIDLQKYYSSCQFFWRTLASVLKNKATGKTPS